MVCSTPLLAFAPPSTHVKNTTSLLCFTFAGERRSTARSFSEKREGAAATALPLLLLLLLEADVAKGLRD